jgi:hypothetical protein
MGGGVAQGVGSEIKPQYGRKKKKKKEEIEICLVGQFKTHVINN